MSHRIKPGTRVVIGDYVREFVVSHLNKEENIATLIAFDKNHRFYNVDAAVCLLEVAPNKEKQPVKAADLDISGGYWTSSDLVEPAPPDLS